MINPTQEQLLLQLEQLRKLMPLGLPYSNALESHDALVRLGLIHRLAPTLADDDYFALMAMTEVRSEEHGFNIHEIHTLANTELGVVKAEETRRAFAPMLTEEEILEIMTKRGWRITCPAERYGPAVGGAFNPYKPSYPGQLDPFPAPTAGDVVRKEVEVPIADAAYSLFNTLSPRRLSR